MEDLNNMDFFTLVDMLARHTNQYMKMLKNGTTDEEYAECKRIIQKLTVEIEYRRQKNIYSNQPGTTTNSNSN